MKPNVRTFFGCGLCALWVFAVSSTGAATIYSTFGPDPYTPRFEQYTVDWGYIPQTDLSFGRAHAEPFFLTGSPYRLDSVTFDIANDPENSPNLQIGIYYEGGGYPSPTPFTAFAPNPTLTLDNTRQLLTYSFPQPPVLNSGTPYWLVIEPARTDGHTENDSVTYAFSTSSQQPSGTGVRLYDSRTGGWGTWNVQNEPSIVFRLDGTAVPEPGTCALLSLGGLLWWCRARRRRIPGR